MPRRAAGPIAPAGAPGVPVLDVIHLLAILALFALLALIAKGAERLGPRARGSAQREAMGGEERG